MKRNSFMMLSIIAISAMFAVGTHANPSEKNVKDKYGTEELICKNDFSITVAEPINEVAISYCISEVQPHIFIENGVVETVFVLPKAKLSIPKATNCDLLYSIYADVGKETAKKSYTMMKDRINQWKHFEYSMRFSC